MSTTCLSGGKHISRTTRPTFQQIVYTRYAWLWLGPPLARCAKLCTSGFMDNVTLAHNTSLRRCRAGFSCCMLLASSCSRRWRATRLDRVP